LGPPHPAHLSLSVAQISLAVFARLAVDRRRHFGNAEKREITWRQLLQQTSEWEGTLWGKADRIDRNRRLDLPPNTPSLKGTHRDLKKPGGYWEYNDIRVNVLALALLRVFGKPLPEVLKERVMDPIGASDDWEWHGYRNSWVEIDGRQMQSVSGGAHWGGGLFISTRDHARAGLLMLNRGRWGEQQLLPESWVDACTTPCPLYPSYGYLWWLNADGAHCPTAPRTSYFALGVGRNIIWIEPDRDLVVVVRWLEREAFDGFAETVMQAMA
jgi:CubicO group peptidase (beta-lactamase class C family)